MRNEMEYFKFLKSKWVPWAAAGLVCVIALVIVYISSYNAGYAAKKTMIDGKMTTYQQLLKDISNTKSQISDQQSKLASINGKLASNKDEFDRLSALESKKNDMEATVNSDKSKITDLKGQIKTAKAKLANVQGGIQKAKGKPISLGAGRFVVGKDVPPGRYKVTPNGAGSNFVTYDSTGTPDVNTILGSGGVPSYVFSVLSNYIIETEAPVTLTPIK